MLKYLPGTYSTLALPLKRYTAFGRGSYDVTDNINAFLQFNYSTFKTRSQGDAIVLPQDSPFVRSEEHTSELQSLMRISYAVFCLKKKTYHTLYMNTN